jgi:hypothetical protein
MELAPLTVKGRCTVRLAPLWTVSEAHTKELLEPVDVTGDPAAMITSSAAVGTPDGLQVAGVDQTPPTPVLVLVAAVAAAAPRHRAAGTRRRIPANARTLFHKMLVRQAGRASVLARIGLLETGMAIIMETGIG